MTSRSDGHLEVRPVTLKRANAYVAEHHRHLRAARGCVFCVSVWASGELHGVAIVGRPSARLADDGRTAEVTRCCTDGTRNACSKLYAAAAKAARALGFLRIVTYTLPEEGGASLRAAGWTCEGDAFGGGVWSRDGRERIDDHPLQPKLRWAA